MVLRKWTSLLIMVGFLTSLFHSLAHAQTPDIHNHSVMQVETMTSADHDNDLANKHCEVCHVFGSMMVIGFVKTEQSFAKMQRFIDVISTPLPSHLSRLSRPPCFIS